MVADTLRGKRVHDALTTLSFTTKRAAPGLRKLLLSAVANAKQQGVSNTDDLRITDIRVDKGFTFVRYHPGFGGRATPINRESSHVTLMLGEGTAAASKKDSEKTEKKTA